MPCESQHLNAVQLTLEQVDLIKRLIEKYSQQMQFAASKRGKCSFIVMRKRGMLRSKMFKNDPVYILDEVTTSFERTFNF